MNTVPVPYTGHLSVSECHHWLVAKCGGLKGFDAKWMPVHNNWFIYYYIDDPDIAMLFKLTFGGM